MFFLKIDDITAAQLKLAAKENMRSPTQHAIFILRQALPAPEETDISLKNLKKGL